MESASAFDGLGVVLLFFLVFSSIASAAGPAAPTNVSATAPLATMASLTWTASAGASSYNIYRGTSAGSETKLPISVLGTFYEDTNLTDGTTYHYKVSAVNGSSVEGPLSTEIALLTLPPSPGESTFSATGGDSQVVLKWGASATATAYRVYRDTVGGVGGATNFLVTGTSYTDKGLINGTTYYYCVVPINASGQNYCVAVVGPATPKATSSSEAPAGAPPNLTVTAGNTLTILNWMPVSNATSYNIYRGTSSKSESLVRQNVTALTFTDTGLTNGITYFYEVSAVNSSNVSPPSTEASATPYIPATPATPIPTASSGLVTLNWTATGTSYAIYRSVTPGSEKLLDSGLTGSTYTDANVTNGTTYFYKVQCLNAGGSSPLSSEVSATPSGPAASFWQENVDFSLPGEPVQSCTVSIADTNRPILAAMLRPEGPNMGAIANKYNAVVIAIDGFAGFNFGTPNNPIGLNTPSDLSHGVCIVDYRWPQLSARRIQAVLTAIQQLLPSHKEIANTGLILDGFSTGEDNVNLAASPYYDAQKGAITPSPLANRVLAIVQLSELDEDIVNPVVTLDASPHLFIASGLSDGNSTLNLGLDDFGGVAALNGFTHDTLARGIATNQGGPFTVLNNAGGGHGDNSDHPFISTWLDSILSQRLPAILPTAAPVSLPSWQNSPSWVGTYNITTSTAAPWGGATGGNTGVQLVSNLVSARTAYTDPRPFTWLPSQNTANTWLAYANTGLMTAFNPVITSPTATSVTLGSPLNYQITASNSPTSYNATGLPLGLSVNPATGVISGIPLAVGTTTISINATNAQGTANGSLALTVSALNLKTFAQWEAGFGINSAPGATPENDGVTNLVKYLCDINPALPMTSTSRAALPALGSATVDGIDYLILTYRQYAFKTNISVVLQTSSNLVTWSPLNTPDLFRQNGFDPVTLDPIMQIGVKAASSGSQFIRLTVTQP